MPVVIQKCEQHSACRPHLRQLVSFSLLLVCVLSLFGACSSSPSTPAAQKVTPVPTPTQVVHKGPPQGTVLYKADWSRGINGWQGASGWTVQHGELYSKGGGEDVLTVPYVSSAPDYAVEIHVQVTRFITKNRGSFSFFTRHSGHVDGYIAGVSDLLAPGPRPNGLNPQLQAFIDPHSDAEQNGEFPFDYDPKLEAHVYRLEVRGSSLDFFADGVNAYQVSSSVSPNLSSGPLYIQSYGIILRVTSLVITAL